jgi:hypothetical protein
MKDMIRPIMSIIALVALIAFYFLSAFGYSFPPEIHGLWAIVIWWYSSRQIEKRNNKEGRDAK